MWAVLVVAGAFTVLLGLVVDGGNTLDVRQQAHRVAAQASRQGADELSSGIVRSGGDSVATSAAVARAQSYLRAAGMHGTVQVSADTVTVTVTGRARTRILSVIGIGSFPVRESESAQGIEKEGD